MSYSSALPDFPTNVIVAQSLTWITPQSVQKLINALDSVYFPIVSSRETGYEVLRSLVGPPPFSFMPPFRFSAGTAYLSSIDPVLDRILEQLMSSLSYKDRLLEKTNIGNQVCSVTSNTPQYLLAFNSFQSAKLELVRYSNDYTNYFDQFTFETYYTLTWS